MTRKVTYGSLAKRALNFYEINNRLMPENLTKDKVFANENLISPFQILRENE